MFEVLLKLLSEMIFARLASSVMKVLQQQVQVSKTYLWLGKAGQQFAGSRAPENEGSLSRIMSTKSYHCRYSISRIVCLQAKKQ